MKFSDRVLQRARIGGFSHLMNWIAEKPSLQPTMTKYGVDFQWLPHYTRAKEGIYAYILSLYLAPWNTDKLAKRLSESCYFHRYEGEWNKLQTMLEQIPDYPSFEEKYQNFFSDNDFFGNVLPALDSFLRRNRLRNTSQPYDADRRKPKRLQRHRGYRDKGSLRPYHQRGRNLPDPSPGEDRRSRISHPMTPICELNIHIYAEEGDAGETRLGKEEKS